VKTVSTRLLSYSRAKALVGAVYLIFVPTFFTVIPGWTKWSGLWRGLLLILWLLVAGWVLTGEIRRSERIDSLTEDRRQFLRQLRVMGTSEVLHALLSPGSRGIPDQYEFTLYVYDSDKNLLAPLFPQMDFRSAPDPRCFEPGNGATGSAWTSRRIVVVTGSEVASGHYGLTKEQQEFFAGYNAVAAAVVWKEGTEPIGVVTAIAKTDDAYFDGLQGLDSLRVLADVLGVVLSRIPDPEDLV
jgi:hypothetical protein